MASVWFCKPAFGCTRTDRTCCLLKDNGQNRLDIVYPDVHDAGSYLYRTCPEDDRTDQKHGSRTGNLFGRRSAVHRCDPSDGTWCHGCTELSEEIIYSEKRSVNFLLHF